MAARPRIINNANKNRKNQKKSNNSNKNKKKKEEMEFQSEEDLYRRIKFGINIEAEEEENDDAEDITLDEIPKKKEPKQKKPKKKSKLKVLFIIALVIGALVLISKLSFFSIKDIETVGNNFLPKERIIELSEVNIGDNIFEVGKLRTIDLLEANPYIEEANIDKKLPSTFVIKIVEREPAFIITNGEVYAYISSQGYILEIVDSEPLRLPTLVGLKEVVETMKVGNRLGQEDLQQLNKILNVYESAKRYEVAELITSIDVSNEDNFTLVMEQEGKKVYLGDCSDLNTRMLELQVILRREQGHRGEVFLNVDLNTQRAYFREST